MESTKIATQDGFSNFGAGSAPQLFESSAIGFDATANRSNMRQLDTNCWEESLHIVMGEIVCRENMSKFL